MTPRLAVLDVPDGRICNAVESGELHLRKVGLKCANLADLFCSETGHSVTLSDLMCSMRDLVGNIFRMRGPAKMGRVDATKVSIAAAMGNLMFHSGSIAILRSADQRANAFSSAVVFKFGIPAPISAEGPAKTSVANKTKRSIKESFRLTFKSTAAKRIAVTPPTSVVHLAPTATLNRFVTIDYGARYGVCHHKMTITPCRIGLKRIPL